MKISLALFFCSVLLIVLTLLGNLYTYSKIYIIKYVQNKHVFTSMLHVLICLNLYVA